MESAWLNSFILHNLHSVRPSVKERAYLFNFIRRTEGAFSAYRAARLALIEYVSTPPTVISPYFRSLLNFEVCVSQCWQACELVMTMTGDKKGAFKPNDNSDAERLYGLYIDAKHMDDMIDKGNLLDAATTGLWITNQGLESTRTPSGVAFSELIEILTSMGQEAETLARLDPFNPDAPAA